ncbi:MAG: T9SS type A sorting domain-containing protein [Candidatus Krumholzibacteriota bacterium]|nr:T9SS type A sorting domain-containing protein [Candidatus Krumholzibacteriota bacterium]
MPAHRLAILLLLAAAGSARAATGVGAGDPVAADLRPPAIDLLAPAEGQALPAGGVQAFRWIVADSHLPADSAAVILRIRVAGAVAWEAAFAPADSFHVDWTAPDQEGAAGDWTVSARDAFGNASSAPASFVIAGAGTAAPPPPPAAVELTPAHPNPFNPATTLRFSLPRPARATLAVFDVAGRRVALLADGPLPAGRHAVRWEAAGQASGVYLARLECEGAVRVRRLVLLK